MKAMIWVMKVELHP